MKDNNTNMLLLLYCIIYCRLYS